MRVIVLTGSPGSGKTTVANCMLEKLPEIWEYIDAENSSGVRGMIDKLNMLAVPAILEVTRIVPVLRKALLQHDVTVVQVWCTERERSRRQNNRQHPYFKAESPQQHHFQFDTTNLSDFDVDRLCDMAGKPRAMTI